MSTKQPPVVPPKPARLSMRARKSASPITTPRSPLTEQPLYESPPSSPSPKTPSTGESTPVGTVSFSVPVGRQARALYDFEGEPEFRELSFCAGDVLNVLREQLAEGWSMAEKDGITGLVPDSYITVYTIVHNQLLLLRRIQTYNFLNLILISSILMNLTRFLRRLSQQCVIKLVACLPVNPKLT